MVNAVGALAGCLTQLVRAVQNGLDAPAGDAATPKGTSSAATTTDPAMRARPRDVNDFLWITTFPSVRGIVGPRGDHRFQIKADVHPSSTVFLAGRAAGVETFATVGLNAVTASAAQPKIEQTW